MASQKKVSLKLLVDRKGKRVLFAEAGKEFVDFLFHIFSLPLGTVARLLAKEKMVGCLGKLYGSIEDLNNTYLQSSANKDDLLKRKTVAYSSNVPLLLPGNSTSPPTKKLYCCPNIFDYECNSDSGSDDPQAICPTCKTKINSELKYVAGANVNAVAPKGYVKEAITFMIMDDLQVKPMSTISSVTLINSFKVHDLRLLEERVVFVSMHEGLKLLKASVQSETVLTDVFFVKEES